MVERYWLLRVGPGALCNFAMGSQLSEEVLWAGGLAARLRLLQANFADDSSADRQNYLIEEIEGALKSVSPTKKKLYLDCLSERFPAWQGLRSTAKSDVQVGAAPLAPEELVRRLVELAPTLSPEARRAFALELQPVGLSIKESADVFLDLPPDLQKKLGLAAGKPLQLERAVKLLAITTELTLALDQLVWRLWKELAAKSVIRRDGEFNRLAGPFLAGDADVSPPQLAQLVERTRRLISAMLNAVGKAGPDYAKEYMRHMSPDSIEEWGTMEKTWKESKEAACWRKYLQQAKEHASEAAIDREIQDAIVKATESIYQGRVAP